MQRDADGKAAAPDPTSPTRGDEHMDDSGNVVECCICLDTARDPVSGIGQDKQPSCSHLFCRLHAPKFCLRCM